MRMRHIANITGGDENGVRQARRVIDTNVDLESEVPVVSLSGLGHFRVSFLVFVLGQCLRRDQRRVADCAFTHDQALRRQVAVGRVENLARQFGVLEQLA